MEITHKIMEIAKKLRVAKLWFLCTTLLHDVCCQCLSFKVDGFYSLKDMVKK